LRARRRYCAQKDDRPPWQFATPHGKTGSDVSDWRRFQEYSPLSVVTRACSLRFLSLCEGKTELQVVGLHGRRVNPDYDQGILPFNPPGWTCEDNLALKRKIQMSYW
jgi:hypothetical protein